MKKILARWPLPVFFLLAGAGNTACDPPSPTAEEVVARMTEADRIRTPLLNDYTSIRRYTVLNKRFGTRAAMTVRMTYHYPGSKRFEVLSESGSSSVRKQVFRKMLESEQEASGDKVREATQIASRNYSFRLAGTATVEGRRCYVLDAEPKSRNRFLFRGRVWVDSEEYAVIRIEASPAQSPSFWVRKTAFVHRYEKFGPFWLAVSNRSETDVLIFGHTEVQIEYSGYKFNQESGAPSAGQ